MNAQFKARLASAGINFAQFLMKAGAALVKANNPKYASLVDDASTILSIHEETKGMSDDAPREAGEIALADPNGGFKGSHRAGSGAGAVNGHHTCTTDTANRVVGMKYDGVTHTGDEGAHDSEGGVALALMEAGDVTSTVRSDSNDEKPAQSKRVRVKAGKKASGK